MTRQTPWPDPQPNDEDGKRKSKKKEEICRSMDELAFDSFELSRKLERAKNANQLLKAQLNASLRTVEDLERIKGILLGLSDRKNAAAWARPANITRGEATAMYVLSDLHIAEVVRPEQVLGVNTFNQHVAASRLQQVTHRNLLLTGKEREIADIKELCVFLGGDIIGGQIHDEQMEVNDLGIAGSIDLAEELLEKALRTWWKEGGFKQMTVVCLSGNHDRMTKKVRHSSFFENSNASTIYLHLRKRFADIKGVKFVLGDGEYADQKVYDWNIRLTHGHRVKFGGGIGGLSIPWTKHVMRLNKARKADFTIGGHLHTWTHNRENGFLVNGSLIGTTPYSLPLGHEEPCQAFVVIDKNRGVTLCQPVFCQ